MNTFTITVNPDYNSTEINFTEKPDEATRTLLKANRFRWHGVKKVWYGYLTPEAVTALLNGETTTTAPQATRSSAPVNKYGLKVGDILTDSFGYNMTIVEYYKVTEILTPTNVKIVRIGCTIDHREAGGTEYVLPDVNNELGAPEIKRTMPDRYNADGFHITIDSCVSLRRWNGQAQYQNTWD